MKNDLVFIRLLINESHELMKLIQNGEINVNEQKIRELIELNEEITIMVKQKKKEMILAEPDLIKKHEVTMEKLNDMKKTHKQRDNNAC